MRWRYGLFGVIAALMLSELLLSNLGTLVGALEATAQQLGLTPEAERARLLTLIALDAVAGGGALATIWGMARRDARVGRAGVWLCAGGLVAYGLYQGWSALAVLAPVWRGPILGVAVTYALVGALAWWAGAPLRRAG